MIKRLKRSFTTGEISPVMYGSIENDRFKHGCKTMYNAFSRVQGPAVRRSGFQMIADLDGMGATEGILVPFVFSAELSYMLVFYKNAAGNTYMIIGYGGGLIEDPASPGNPLTYAITGTFELDEIYFEQSGNWVFLAQSSRILMGVNRISHDNWSIVDITFTDAPVTWAGSNYPRKIGFYEERMIFASSEAAPQTIWSSKSGDFFVFTSYSAPTVASDPFSFTISSGQKNDISWLAPSSALLMGTLGDEWVVTGAAYSPLSFDSFSAKPHTNYGSEYVKPIRSGSAILFVEQLGRRVVQLAYDYNVNGYDGTDISILAPHLTETYDITKWAYQKVPNSVIWAVRSDGALLGLTYQLKNKVVGWHRHGTNGEFIDVGCKPGENRESELWVLVTRTREGSSRLYLEKKAPEFHSDDVKDSRFLDSFKTYTFGTASDTLTGLEHLEGLTVDVLADGYVIKELTVDSGEVTLPYTCSEAVVGLQYDTEIEPTLVDYATQEGTTFLSNSMIRKIELLFYRTLGGEIQVLDGKSFNETYELPYRQPEDEISEQVSMVSSSYSVEPPSEYSQDLRIIIRQSDPLPMEIRGFVDHVEVY